MCMISILQGEGGLCWRWSAVFAILPLSDTILLPQLSSIEREMDSSSGVITATMSLYLLACGAGFLIWVPFTDWFGRLPTYHAALALCLGTSIGCALAPGIVVLLLCRALQGLAAAGTFSVGNAVVADVFPISVRGLAYGVFTMPGMLGPIIAPFVGASLSHALGWRSTMWFMAVMSGLAQLAVLVIYRETQPSRLIRRVRQQLKAANLPLPAWAAPDALADQPSTADFLAPLKLVGQFVRDMTLLPFLLLGVHAFSCMFLLLVQLPDQLSAAGLNSLMVGLSFLSTGACSMVGTLAGGWLADRAAAAQGAAETARLEWSSCAVLVGMPPGLLLFGWAGKLQGSAAVAATLIGASVACFASSVLLPAVLSYISQKAKEQAGAAGSLQATGMNVWAAVLVQINPLARGSIGIPVYNSIIAASLLLISGLALGVCLCQRRLSSRASSASISGSQPGQAKEISHAS